MRASDIVSQLALTLPKLVDDFTTNISVSSISRSGTTATATTATAHGLAAGDQVNITGAQVPIVISSLTRVGIVGTLVTATDHDMTENAGFNVQIDGAAEAEFNGTFTLLSVPNRRTIKFEMADSGATTATGSPLLLNGSSPLASYKGLQEVTAVPTATTFEYEVQSGLFTPASGTIIAKTQPRISATVDFERMLSAYTEQSINEAWLFVMLGDGLVAQRRGIDADSTDNVQPGQAFNSRIIQAVNLYVIMPASNTLAGRSSRDRCEELLSPICQSIVRVKFPSLLSGKDNPLMLTGHGFQFYNGAFYVHQYSFEATLEMSTGDTFIPGDDVAFRDIHLAQTFDVGTGEMDSDIDLDDEVLP